MTAEQHPPLRILIVDDNEELATTAQWLIEAIGDVAETRFNGRSGLDALREFKPDVLLLDVGMPVMDGLAVCAAVRADPEFKHLVCIAQTGYGDAESSKRIRDAGFDYHLLKPVDFEKLSATLDEVKARLKR